MKIKIILLFYFLLSEYTISHAQNIDSIEQVLDSAYSHSPFFANILIAENNKIIFEKSYGFADEGKNIPLTNKNSFQVASISKQFTAYGIMILKSKGLLDYDSLVCKYIPDFPYKNILLRHLLNHTSGLPDFWDGIRPNLDTNVSNGNKEVLDYLVRHRLPLQFEPGTQFQYADIGYDFLATVIENISGQTYQDFMNLNIFQPLKMENTFAYKVTDIRRIENKNLAIGHCYENGKFEYAHLLPKYNFVFYLGDFFGDGSVVTSARDLEIWSEALNECKLLPCTLQNESITGPALNEKPLYARTNPDISYGFGWFLKNTATGKVAYHSGGHPGNSHIMYRFLDRNLTFIFLSNSETTSLKTLRNRVLQMLD